MSTESAFIDPMFTTPANSDAGFAALRSLADHDQLSEEWVSNARRVARRWVVVKAHKSKPWFGDVGLEWVPSNSKAAWYRTPATPD